jgi:hypothetical protein
VAHEARMKGKFLLLINLFLYFLMILYCDLIFDAVSMSLLVYN